MSEPYSIMQPVGFTVASCGYCGADGSARVYGAFGLKLTCKDYQELLDKGFRRSGLYLYKPNLRDSCCRQYTIRLNTSEFVPSKGQRRTIARLGRFIKNQYVPRQMLNEHSPSPEPILSSSSLASTETHPHQQSLLAPSYAAARRKSVSPPLGGKTEDSHGEFLQSVYAADMDKMDLRSDWKRFKVVLEPPTFTQEKYDLYCAYQQEIHQTPSSRLTRDSFENSITRTPLSIEQQFPVQDVSGFVGYGTYHHCYYVDGKLVAVGVLDILPTCISTDYFYYDPSLASLSLGKYSTLREIALVQEIKSIPGYDSMEYYTMGHYVHSSPKTHYKASYHPSYLLNPETYGWESFERCIHILESKRYFSFSQLELFNPRVKGLLITMEAEKRTHAKTQENGMGDSKLNNNSSKNHSTSGRDTSLGAGAIVELLKVQETRDDHGSGSSSEDEVPALFKRKRGYASSAMGGAEEYVRSGKRPSLTPPPPALDLPPPGMMNPDEVTEGELSQLVMYQDGQAMMITDSISYKLNDQMRKAMREYYAAFGPALSKRMLVFVK